MFYFVGVHFLGGRVVGVFCLCFGSSFVLFAVLGQFWVFVSLVVLLVYLGFCWDFCLFFGFLEGLFCSCCIFPLFAYLFIYFASNCFSTK